MKKQENHLIAAEDLRPILSILKEEEAKQISALKDSILTNTFLIMIHLIHLIFV
jgi:hypothetical protein